LENLNIIMLAQFGSHLYGTNDENSDTDYKGIFLPTKEQILLGKIPKSINTSTKKINTCKNTCNDIDTEIYSLHHFITLASQGETVAIDLLHTPKNMTIKTSNIWNSIVENRTKFYTKNLQAFIGYARRQAAKYGIKGSRLNDVQKIVNFLSQFDSSLTLHF